MGKALKGPVAPEADIVRPKVKWFLKELLAEGRGRAGKEGAWLCPPSADDREPGRCRSIPHRVGSFRGGSLKLWERDGRAVNTSVRMSAGEMAGARSHAGSWD